MLVVPDVPSAGPLVDLLRALVDQRLVRPVGVWRVGASAIESTAPFDSVAGEPTRLVLGDYIRGSVKRFTVARVLLADCLDPAPSSDLAVEVERALIESLSIAASELQQAFRAFNVAAPAAAPYAFTDAAFLDGMSGIWSNVVAMPEVQARSGLAVAPIRPDEEYVAHVAMTLVTLLGLWRGDDAGNGASDGSEALSAANLERGYWHLVRTRSRTITAPELPDVVIGQVTRRIPIDSTKHDKQLEPLTAESAARAVGELTDRLFADHHLDAVVPKVGGAQRRRRVGLRALVNMVVAFLRSLPRLLLNELVAWAHGVRRAFVAMVNKVLRTDQLDFEFGDEELEGRPLPAEAAPSGLLVGALAEASPVLWRDLRSMAFGLLDGGPLPASAESLLATPTSRFVVSDPRHVVSAPLSSLDTGDELVRAIDDLPDPAQWDWVPTPFVDRVVWRLHQSAAEAATIATTVAAERAQVVERERQKDEARRSRGWFRRVLSLLWRILRIVVVIAAVLGLIVLLPLALPFAGALANVALVVGWMMLVVGAIAAARRLLVRWFRDQHQRLDDRPEVVRLAEQQHLAEVQRDRLAALADIVREWMVVVQLLVHRPFGSPTRTLRTRVRNADLRLPASHQVCEGEVGALREMGIVNVARSMLFKPGWLGDVYEAAAGFAALEFELTRPLQQFDPDNDRTPGSSPRSGARSILRSALASGSALLDGRNRIAAAVHEMLSTGRGLPLESDGLHDWLFTRVRGADRPAAFLAEALDGGPAQWNRSSVITTGGNTPASSRIERKAVVESSHHPIPSLPTPEQLHEGMRPAFEPLMFRSSVVEVSLNVPASELACFADLPRMVDLDLLRAETLWVRPPDIDSGELVEFDQDERDRWGLDKVTIPPSMQVIRPRRRLEPPTDGGEFRFMLEFDGRPAQVRSGRVPFVVRSVAAPRNAVEIVVDCLQRTADATGLEFEFIGSIADLPNIDGPDNSHDEHLVIGWAFADEYRLLEAAAGFPSGSTIGLGGPRVRIGADGDVEVVGGSAVLNAQMRYSTAMDAWPNHALVLLHEIGHALNLGHVHHPEEVMNVGDYVDGLRSWGVGDRRGLHLVTRDAQRRTVQHG